MGTSIQGGNEVYMSIEVDSKVPGKVTGITNFGAFIDLGNGKTGLVHISEISDSFVKDIRDVLTVGDEVTVKVLTIGSDGKIGLSIRKAVDQPKEAATTRPTSSTSTARPSSSYQRSNDRGSSRGSSSSYQKSSRSPRPQQNKKEDFDTLMSSFLKDSDDRLTTLKRSTEGKRGGRGGRRN